MKILTALILFVSPVLAQTTLSGAKVQQADAAVRAACAQVNGISIGDPTNSATWSIDFQAAATAPCRSAAQTALQAQTLSGAVLNVIAFDTFIGRFTNAEYADLLQKRATAISAGNVALVKQWDTAMTIGRVDLNSTAAQNFKAALVSASVLTQARADVIFN